DSVSGTINDAPAGIINGVGLGPRYNANSCSACHSQPAIGGTSPFTHPPVGPAPLDGGHNKVPSFLTPARPGRRARLVQSQLTRHLRGTSAAGFSLVRL